MKQILRLLLFCLCLGWASHSLATPWSELDPGVQEILGVTADEWAVFPAEKQLRLERGARRWLRMTPAERRLAKRNLKLWKKMTPEERRYLRRKFREFKQLPKEKRQEIKRLKGWFDQLPTERRKKILKRWRRAKDKDAFFEKGLEKVR